MLFCLQTEAHRAQRDSVGLGDEPPLAGERSRTPERHGARQAQ
jgi:hypothetical protein